MNQLFLRRFPGPAEDPLLLVHGTLDRRNQIVAQDCPVAELLRVRKSSDRVQNYRV